jgi:hypothetical protein
MYQKRLDVALLEAVAAVLDQMDDDSEVRNWLPSFSPHHIVPMRERACTTITSGFTLRNQHPGAACQRHAAAVLYVACNFAMRDRKHPAPSAFALVHVLVESTSHAPTAARLPLLPSAAKSQPTLRSLSHATQNV